MRFFCTLLTLVVILTGGLCSAGNSMEPARLVERLQERAAGVRDYQCLITSYERKGDREEVRTYRLFVKDCRLVRIKVVAGRGKGSEAARDAAGRIRARKGGVLKVFSETVKPEDSRIRSLRGIAFWEVACHNFLAELHTRMTQPGTRCELDEDPKKPDHIVLAVDGPGAVRERVWIDPEQMRVVQGELYEGDLLLHRFSVSEVKENVGLKDGFFSF